MMPQNVNCQCFDPSTLQGLHAAAPRRWFTGSPCLLVNAPGKDPRIESCALQYPYHRPDGKPNPPPCRVIREGNPLQLREPIAATRAEWGKG